jgi:hypothetical protein
MLKNYVNVGIACILSIGVLSACQSNKAITGKNVEAAKKDQKVDVIVMKEM